MDGIAEAKWIFSVCPMLWRQFRLWNTVHLQWLEKVRKPFGITLISSWIWDKMCSDPHVVHNKYILLELIICSFIYSFAYGIQHSQWKVEKVISQWVHILFLPHTVNIYMLCSMKMKMCHFCAFQVMEIRAHFTISSIWNPINSKRVHISVISTVE